MTREIKDLFTHLLVIVEADKPMDLVLTRGVRLAQQSGGKITIMVSLYQKPTEANTQDVLAANLGEQIEDKLTLLDGDSQVQEVVFFDHVPLVQAVKDLQAEKHFTLILKSPENHDFFRDWFTKNLDSYFISESDVPVWMVKPTQWEADSDILACLDLSDDDSENQSLNQVLLACGDQVAKLFGLSLHVIDCYFGEIGTMDFHYDPDSGFRKQASLKEQHQDKLQQLIQGYSLAKDDLHFVEGIPEEAIPETAMALNAELAIIGHNKHSGLMERIFGDTAIKLTDSMPCDILIIKAWGLSD